MPHEAPFPPDHHAAYPDLPGRTELTAALLRAREDDDLPGIIACGAKLRRAFPSSAPGYQIVAAALCKAGRTNEAAGLLALAERMLEDPPWLLLERARLAELAGDWPEVEELTASLRQRQPDKVTGWRLGFTALRVLNRVDEADALGREAFSRWPQSEWLLEGLAALALRRHAWAEAAGFAAALREAHSANEQGFRIGVRALRRLGRLQEAATLSASAGQLYGARLWLMSENARAAHARGDWLNADRLWLAVRHAFPEERDGYTGGFKALLALRQVDDAESLHEQATARFRPAAWFMAQQAELLHARGASGEAAERWAALSVEYPDALEGYHGGYRIFRQLGQLGEAEALLTAMLARFPNDRWVLSERALLARARFDFDEVDRRWAAATAALPDDPEIALRFALARSQDRKLDSRDWQTTRDRLAALNARFPDHLNGWLEHIRTLRLIGATEDADTMAQACLRQMPDAPELWLEYARIAGEGAGETASDRLASAAARFPDDAAVQSAYAEALARAGQYEAAERQYDYALGRFPDIADLLCGRAALAMRRQDWRQALAYWHAAQAKVPADLRIQPGLLDTHAALSEAGTTEQDAARPPDGRAAEVQSDRARLFLRFESFGGTGQGCEFGVVQRAAGVEPLGLFRWMHITPASLIEGLRTRFEGMGSSGQTVLDYFTSEDPANPEYRYRDTKLATRMHTFVRKKDVGFDDMFRQTCRRIVFLRRKLIEDLEAAEKIFVYKIYERNLAPSELQDLHAAVRTYGNTTLLYVCYCDEANPSGSVRRIAEGLLTGYISGFNVNPVDDSVRAPDLPAWDAICRAAVRLRAASGVSDA